MGGGQTPGHGHPQNSRKNVQPSSQVQQQVSGHLVFQELSCYTGSQSGFETAITRSLPLPPAFPAFWGTWLSLGVSLFYTQIVWRHLGQ